MPDHVLGDGDAVVCLAVVHLEAQAHEARKDGGGAGVCPYGRDLVTLCFGPCDGEAVFGRVELVLVCVVSGWGLLEVGPYGIRFGPGKCG